MSHNIAVIDGREAFFSGEGIGAWHGLGTNIEGLATAEEALQLASLDWDVLLVPVQYKISGQNFQFSDRFVTVRSTDHFPYDVVGGDYTVLNNREAFSFLDSVIDSGDAKYTTAGALANGARVFMTAKVGDGFTVADSDKIETYLCVTTSHDGKRAFTAFTTTIRVVCENTLTMALAGAKNRWSLTHRNSLTGKVQEARESLNLALQYQDAFEAEVAELLDVEVTKDQFKAIVTQMLPDQPRKKERSITELLDVFENEKTVNEGGGEGTGWAALNALTYWTDWRKEWRNAEARSKSLTDGVVSQMRNDFRNRVLALA